MINYIHHFLIVVSKSGSKCQVSARQHAKIAERCDMVFEFLINEDALGKQLRIPRDSGCSSENDLLPITMR